jgi:hypothetical protein
MLSVRWPTIAIAVERGTPRYFGDTQVQLGALLSYFLWSSKLLTK